MACAWNKYGLEYSAGDRYFYHILNNYITFYNETDMHKIYNHGWFSPKATEQLDELIQRCRNAFHDQPNQIQERCNPENYQTPIKPKYKTFIP